jgi:putative flippase GtrA
VSAVDSVLLRIPKPYRDIAVRHVELLKFGIVGAITFVIDTAVFYTLKLSVLSAKPVTAKIIAVAVATVVSYVLNREWSFRARGGRERHHEATLYFVVSVLSVAMYAAPLWISRYLLHLEVPYTVRPVQEIADFVSGQIVGLLVGMVFRWWAFRKWVFPHRDGQGSARRGFDLPGHPDHLVGASDAKEDLEHRRP